MAGHGAVQRDVQPRALRSGCKVSKLGSKTQGSLSVFRKEELLGRYKAVTKRQEDARRVS